MSDMTRRVYNPSLRNGDSYSTRFTTLLQPAKASYSTRCPQKINASPQANLRSAKPKKKRGGWSGAKPTWDNRLPVWDQYIPEFDSRGERLDQVKPCRPSLRNIHRCVTYHYIGPTWPNRELYKETCYHV